MTINLLPEEIINQIAAGEVIENPSAVVKELVENSIDSGASIIDIEIEDSGLKKIIISDNGCGISKEDLLKAPLRHATSKIKEFNDLYAINTMGFRGEALASIFSVAKTKIISRVNGEGFAYEISSDNVSEVLDSACSMSTTIVVEDLFYKTPARRKYLKSSNMELKAIVDIVNRFEVFYSNVKINLKHNGKVLVNKPAFDLDEKNLLYVLGKDLKGNLIEFSEEMHGIKVSGFIGNPSELTYSFRKNQYLYVNKRYVKSKLVRDAIYEGFTSNLMVGRHPFFVLFVEIDPEIIDVNVHPTKIEIRFENELEIYEFVKKVINKQFEVSKNFKEFEPKEYDVDLSEKIDVVKSYEPIVSQKDDSSKYYSSEKQSSFEIKEDEIVYEKPEIKIEEIVVEEEEVVRGVLWDELSDYKILGQLNKTYILVETPNQFLIVDQHVAEEKFYYEKFKRDFESGRKVKTQFLLKPEVISLTNSEVLLYEENKDVLNSIGFETEKFGENDILVRAVPINVRREIVSVHNLRDMLYDILVNKKIKCVEDEAYSKIASMACRISIMAGDELSMPQMKRMIENLRSLKQPFNCPHGRPTFLKYEYKDLEKKFKRIV